MQGLYVYFMTFLVVAVTFAKDFASCGSFTRVAGPLWLRETRNAVVGLEFKSLTPPTTHAQFDSQAHRAETKLLANLDKRTFTDFRKPDNGESYSSAEKST